MTDNKQRGSSLVEALVALFLLMVSLVGIAPLFVFAMHNGVADADMGRVGAVGVERMEQINALPYSVLINGGSLTQNIKIGAATKCDKQGPPQLCWYDDSDPDVLTRWIIGPTNPSNPNLKQVQVIAIARTHTTGPRKTVTLATIRVKG